MFLLFGFLVYTIDLVITQEINSIGIKFVYTMKKIWMTNLAFDLLCILHL